MRATVWALVGSAVTLLLIVAVRFPLQAVAVATVAASLTAVGSEAARRWQDSDP